MLFSRNLTILALSLVGLYSHISAQTPFKDVTEEAGINHQFKVYEGMFGGGICVLDINNDGYEDLFITGGMNRSSYQYC